MMSARKRRMKARQTRTQLKSTKSDQNQSQVVQTIAFGISLVVAVLALLLVISASFLGFLVVLGKPDQPKNIVIVSTDLDGKEGDIFYLGIDPEKRRLQVLQFEAELVLPLPKEYGEYSLRSVHTLWELDGLTSEDQIPLYTYTLGRVIDEVWVLPNAETIQDVDLESGEVAQVVAWKAKGQSLEERAWLWWFGFTIDSSRVISRTIASQKDLREQEDISFTLDSSCSIAVVNTTDQPGLATKVSKVIEQTGGRTVRVTDALFERADSKLVINPESTHCYLTADRLRSLFPLGQGAQLHESLQMSKEYRADIVLKIGRDVAALGIN